LFCQIINDGEKKGFIARHLEPPLLFNQCKKRNSCAESISRPKWASVTVASGVLEMFDR
jgi:hypothetical protein